MGILDLVFPKSCLECGKSGLYICGFCSNKVRRLKPACPYCEKASIDGFTHTKCKKKYGLDGLTSIWDYEGVIRKAILSLKYKYATEVGKELSARFINELAGLDTKMQGVLIPIPIYWHRENMRGFNQSGEIGKLAAKEMEWGFEPGILIKRRPTMPQASLTVLERKQNLRGVFDALASNLPESIILFDDVFTTGSTLKEAAKVLKRAGAVKVWGLTIAR